MKERLVTMVILIISFAFGAFIGHGAGFLLFDRQYHPHLCTCEMCKVQRQLEACEVIDSIIRERIVINIENGDE